MKYKPVRKTIYTVRVVYKSGYYHDFDVYNFTVQQGKCSWTAVSSSNAPIDIATSLSDIESVWQVGLRKVWRLE